MANVLLETACFHLEAVRWYKLQLFQTCKKVLLALLTLTLLSQSRLFLLSHQLFKNKGFLGIFFFLVEWNLVERNSRSQLKQ